MNTDAPCRLIGPWESAATRPPPSYNAGATTWCAIRESVSLRWTSGRQRGTTVYLGSLDKLVSNPGRLPKATTGQAAADISGQTTSALHVGVGLSILKSVLSAFGGNVGVTTQYSKVETIRLQFGNVKANVVPPLDIAKFLNERVVASDPLIDRYVEGDGQLFVITETVTSNEITVIAELKDGTQVKLDVPVIRAQSAETSTSRLNRASREP